MINSVRGSFSLVGSIVALCVSTLVMLGTTVVIFHVSQDKAKVNLQGQLDFLHLEGLQILSNGNHLKNLFLNQVPQIQLCFQRKGTACNTFNNRKVSPVDDSGKIKLNAFYGSNGSCAAMDPVICPFQRIAEVTFHCSSAETCESIEVALQTNYLGTQILRSQRTTKKLAARALEQRHNLSFACVGGGRFVSGIDYEKLTAKCEGMPPERLHCISELPLQGFGNQVSSECHSSPIQASCAGRGLSETGLIGGTHVCAP
ncbi:MAG: hypothetical protein HUU57_13760 [Bdellovibrio sp.]|nr:hypothetical protein [Bdellovibrio sp.]